MKKTSGSRLPDVSEPRGVTSGAAPASSAGDMTLKSRIVRRKPRITTDGRQTRIEGPSSLPYAPTDENITPKDHPQRAPERDPSRSSGGAP